MNGVPQDLETVTDPWHALAVSQAGLEQQRALDPWVVRVTRDLEALRRENHIAERMANLERARRWQH